MGLFQIYALNDQCYHLIQYLKACCFHCWIFTVHPAWFQIFYFKLFYQDSCLFFFLRAGEGMCYFFAFYWYQQEYLFYEVGVEDESHLSLQILFRLKDPHLGIYKKLLNYFVIIGICTLIGQKNLICVFIKCSIILHALESRCAL